MAATGTAGKRRERGLSENGGNRPPGNGAVEVIHKSTAYRGYFRIDRYRLRHRQFAGGMGPAVTREVFERGHAAAVLPYDPAADAVVLIEQFRMGPFVCDDEPWLLEIVAGIVEEGEKPEDVARREAMEEADLTIGRLERICRYYVSPGGTSESVQLYCGRVAAPPSGGVHGLADEGEDIRVHTVPFAEAQRLLAEERIVSSPAVMALFWLALNRDRLRREWAA